LIIEEKVRRPAAIAITRDQAKTIATGGSAFLTEKRQSKIIGRSIERAIVCHHTHE